MHLLAFCGILAIIVSKDCVAVHPGDPFPSDLSKTNILTSEDIINDNIINDPNDNDDDDEISSESLLNDEEESMDFITSTSTKSTSTSTRLRQKNNAKKNIFREKLFPSPSTKTTTTTISTITSPVPVTESFDHENSIEETILYPGKSINRKNLIKIGRWKYTDQQTKTIRYWYEPESGQMGTGWTFDGFLFQAYNKSEADTEPVYAFHSEIRSVWTNTIQMDPKSPIIGNDQWIPDGVSFYAYRSSLNSTELQPVLRYWNKLKEDATDATETRITYLTTQAIEENNDDEDEFEWTFDKILFYVLPIED